MSILIKGMEMPKTCLQCMNTGFRTAIKCTEWTKLSSGLRETIKAPSCPLVEIPERHGRLIDENEVRTVMNWLLTQPQRPTWNDLYHAIQEMEAIIEAEGVEE